MAALRRPLARSGWAVAQDAPDAVYTGGKVVTVDDAFSVAEAFAVEGRPLRRGGLERGRRRPGGRGDRARRPARPHGDPGLIDSHLHQLRAALNLSAVSLTDARSMAEVTEAIAARVAETPEGEWVLASSAWHEGVLEEGRLPTRADLDAVSPDHPVFIPRGGHVVAVNSRALELAGIGADTPDPEHGVIVRDADGEPTGVLLEDATALVEDLLPAPPPAEEQEALLRRMMAELNAFGVVAVTEPGLSDEGIALYRDLEARDALTTRVQMLYFARDASDVERAAGAYEPDATCADMLCFSGVKFLLDGGVEGARLYEPYQVVPGEQPDPAYRGVMILPEDGLDGYRAALEVAAEAGLQVQTHGVGDETLDAIVAAYEAVDGGADAEVGLDGLRWVVMHVFLPTPEAIATMAELKILTTAQNHPVLLGFNERRWWGEERAAYAIPVRDLVEAGLVVGGGTDAPVAPPNPFLSLWWMVTRGTLGGEPLGPDQAVDLETALRLWTVDSATVQLAEGERGSIQPGLLADFAVLSDDILTIPTDEIPDLRAVMTAVGGRVVHGGPEEL